MVGLYQLSSIKVTATLSVDSAFFEMKANIKGFPSKWTARRGDVLMDTK